MTPDELDVTGGLDGPRRDAKGRWLAGGGSPNPEGRPRGRSVVEHLEAILSESAPDGSDATRMEYLLRRLVERAEAGDAAAFREIGDRLSPRPKAPIDVSLVPMELSLSTLVSMIGSAESLPVPDFHQLNAAGELELKPLQDGDETEAH